MEYTISQIQKAVAPNPFCLITTRKPDGATNAMALSWWTFVSNRPATIAVCLSQKGYSGELIAKNSEFALNIVGEALKDSAFRCGTCSGRSVDKIAEFGIELAEPSVINTKLVAGSRVSLECRLIQTVPVQDHTMYIAEVVETHLNEGIKQLYAFDGYGRLDTI